MQRRDFIVTGLTAGTTTILGAGQSQAAQQETAHKPFRLNYAPNFRIFKDSAGEDLVDQLNFMHDQGFRALEDNKMGTRSVEDQNRVFRDET